ncbi:MAG: DUF2892 domain-containing protein [Acidimicrobiia bacterium]
MSTHLPTPLTPMLSSDAGRRRWSINISAPERFGRIVLGSLAALAGVVLLVGAGSVVAVVLELLLIAAGLDLIVTGALGHCPLYQKLGHIPRSLRSSR